MVGNDVYRSFSCVSMCVGKAFYLNKIVLEPLQCPNKAFLKLSCSLIVFVINKKNYQKLNKNLVFY